MAVVGEQTGHLPEAFGELERYFELQWKLRKQFIADITWPIIEFTGAVGVITLLNFRSLPECLAQKHDLRQQHSPRRLKPSSCVTAYRSA